MIVASLIVDTSALLSILLGAPDSDALLAALVDAPNPRMSVANWPFGEPAFRRIFPRVRH